MAKKTVRIYLSTFIDVEVDATDRDDAIDRARAAFSDIQAPAYDNELYGNLALCDDFDVTDNE